MTTLPKDPCAGSRSYPTNYDGEVTICDQCGRKLKLHMDGRLPHHNKTAKPETVLIDPRSR